ncbi:hypothetical protein Ancab_000840 [Ancistrocladus abbreviatus]
MATSTFDSFEKALMKIELTAYRSSNPPLFARRNQLGIMERPSKRSLDSIINSYIIDYLILLDLLIDDPKDVEILIEKGIVTNGLGNDEDVSNLFGNLTKQINIIAPTFYYLDVYQQLNDYWEGQRRHAGDLQSPSQANFCFSLPWHSSLTPQIMLILLSSGGGGSGIAGSIGLNVCCVGCKCGLGGGLEPSGLCTCKFCEAAPRELRSESKHLVDFLLACYLPSSPRPEPVGPDNLPFCFSVSYLHKAGVKIVPAKESSLLDITFYEGVLRIPEIMIQDSTESLWKNLLVFEQCHYYVDSYIIEYLILLDLLIDDPKDVEILIKKGIVTNGLGNNEDVSNLFGNLTKQSNIIAPNFYYLYVCQQLNDYYNSTWHKNKAILR